MPYNNTRALWIIQLTRTDDVSVYVCLLRFSTYVSFACVNASLKQPLSVNARVKQYVHVRKTYVSRSQTGNFVKCARKNFLFPKYACAHVSSASCALHISRAQIFKCARKIFRAHDKEKCSTEKQNPCTTQLPCSNHHGRSATQRSLTPDFQYQRGCFSTLSPKINYRKYPDFRL